MFLLAKRERFFHTTIKPSLMNLKEIKERIKISSYLFLQGHKPFKETNGQLAYLSPFRKETVPSFLSTIPKEFGMIMEKVKGDYHRFSNEAPKVGYIGNYSILQSTRWK